jgi:hypothetical protein
MRVRRLVFRNSDYVIRNTNGTASDRCSVFPLMSVTRAVIDKLNDWNVHMNSYAEVANLQKNFVTYEVVNGLKKLSFGCQQHFVNPRWIHMRGTVQ